MALKRLMAVHLLLPLLLAPVLQAGGAWAGHA